jgi:hypothetical protein
MRLICDRTTRVELSGVDIGEYIVGLDPWQRSVLKLYWVPFETPEQRQARHRRMSRMRAAYRARHR